MTQPPSTAPPSPMSAPSAPGTIDFGAVLSGIGVFGGVRRLLEIGNELVRRGHRYVLYHPGGERPTWLPFAGEVRPLEALPSTQHDVLLVNDYSMLPHFERATARLKCFYSVTGKVRHEKRVVTDRRWTVLANSTGGCERIRGYGVDVEPVIGGIDTGIFRAQPEARPQDGPFRVLAFGRSSRSRVKGLPLILRAVESFARDVSHRRPVQLVLFDTRSAGNEEDSRERIRSHVPIEFHLDLSQTELARLYATCHLYISAERKGGWSNTVAEAMACGVPVVCTRVGTSDLARHRETAWVVRWRHAWFFKRGIRALFDDAALAARLQRNALENVQRFTWKSVVDQLEDVVRRHLGNA